jgi:aryl-alcohol dehydrogenase-like predicted oxidoreductase
VPIETVGAMGELVQQGRNISVCQASVATIRRAIHPSLRAGRILAIQPGPEGLLPVLDQLGIALVAYSPLGRGFLAGRFQKPEDLDPSDWRRGNPRFQGENFAKNVALARHLKDWRHEGLPRSSRSRGLDPQVRGRRIPGTSSVERLENHAIEIELSAADLGGIERLAPKGSASGTMTGPCSVSSTASATAVSRPGAHSPAVAENFAKADPHVTNGLVRKWRVREWTTVVGPTASTPFRA